MATEKAILARLVKNSKARGVEPLRTMIDAYLLERDDSEDRLREHTIDLRPRMRPGGRFSPSALCGCPRAAAFKYTTMPIQRKIDPDLQLVFEDGIWRHHKWDALFLDMQIVLGKERFEVLSYEALIEIPELYIAGNSDAVIRIEGVLIVVDFKGMNKWGHQRVSTNDAPIPEHERQLAPYLKGHRIKRGTLLYDNKDDQHTKIFPVRATDQIWYDITDWIEEVLDHLNAESLPPMHPECSAGTYLYNKCPYAKHCFGTETEVQIRRKMYRKFPGVDEAWEISRQLLREEANAF